MENLTIQSNAETLSRDQTKKYWLIKTNNGNHSVWDEDLAKKLQVGKSYSCDVQINGKYKTIRAIIGEVESNVQAATIKPEEFGKDEPKVRAFQRDPVGLTLDLYKEFIKIDGETVKALGEPLLTHCIEAVKEIQKAFE